MLLSLGLTADAAAAHRHEFSSARPQSYASALPSTSSMTTPPRRARSERLPRPALGKTSSVTFDMAPRPGGIAWEDETDSFSESEGSRTASIDSPTTPTGGQTAFATRSRTSYHLAHPPPSFINRQRLHIRPKLLLQLQQLSVAGRPAPALDVLPSTILPPRLARKFPRFFRGCDGLGPNDLVIVSGEEYGALGPTGQDRTSSFDADISESRHVVATICPRRKEDGGLHGKADICLSDGPLWEASPLPNGGYEFSAVDEHGLKLTARWVPRVRPARRRSSTHGNRAPVNPSKTGKKFTFSIIRPNSRRHPVIAFMTKSTIDVLDSYPTSPPSTTAQSSPSMTPRTPSMASTLENPYFGSQTDQGIRQTDEALRTLILVSGVWVAFREGWSQNFKYNDVMTSPPSEPAGAASSNSGWTRRSLSSPVITATKSPQLGAMGSPGQKSVDGLEAQKRHSFLPRSTTSGVSAASPTGSSTVPRRAYSTGTASHQGKSSPGYSRAQKKSHSATNQLSTRDAMSPVAQLHNARANPDPSHHPAAELASGPRMPPEQVDKTRCQGQVNGVHGYAKPQKPVMKRGWSKIRALASLIKTSVGTH